MDLASIGAVSIDMHMAQTQQSIGIALAKKVMDIQETQTAALIQTMQAAAPSFGHQLDVIA